MTIPHIIHYTTIALTLLFSFFAAYQAHHELQFRARNRFLLLGILACTLLTVFGIAFPIASHYTSIGILFGSIAFLVWVKLLPSPIKPLSFSYERKYKGQIDERDIMFSRCELIDGEQNYINYYNRHPEKQEKDDKIRANPGLMSPESRYYHPTIFSQTEDIFKEVDSLQPHVEEAPNKHKQEVDSHEIKQNLESIAMDQGAVSFGTCLLKEEHYYSIGGRHERYDQSYHKEHEYAIAFTVEMDHEQMMFAPYAPTLKESATQYLNSAKISIQIAQHIRSLGYEARAHIDGNYKVVAPLVARDAGLGELGRMGLLMTPEIGPRVRIGVVTTNMPIELSKYQEDNSMLEFCLLCKKCAHNCPGNAISKDKPIEIDGNYRWQINQEACFNLWSMVGTDCGKCVIVCPYSHPVDFLHNLVRSGIKKSPAFRKIALTADNFFYGEKPKAVEMEKYRI
jgi:reductive dehalogenase